MTITDESAAAADAAELRGVRRIFLVALALALVAAGVALAVELTHHPRTSSADVRSPLPVVFQQAGFVEHSVRRDQSIGIAAERRSGVLQVHPRGGPVYVVVRCDTGRVTVATDTLTSAQPCVGKPVGVVALAQVRRPTRLTVTVNGPQQDVWAVGTYR